MFGLYDPHILIWGQRDIHIGVQEHMRAFARLQQTKGVLTPGKVASYCVRAWLSSPPPYAPAGLHLTIHISLSQHLHSFLMLSLPFTDVLYKNMYKHNEVHDFLHSAALLGFLDAI